jgi:hypothetical protein
MKKTIRYPSTLLLVCAVVSAHATDATIHFTGAVTRPTARMGTSVTSLRPHPGPSAALIDTLSMDKLTDHERGTIPLLDYFADDLSPSAALLAAATIVNVVYH